MLKELHIDNIAVIEHADITFLKGFNTLTGETGAGKSIIIDSIGAVLGRRVSHDLVRTGAEKGTVTAVFDIAGVENWLNDNDIDYSSDDDLIIQRRISVEGKTSCRVNGSPVSVGQLKELGTMLVDIHGQNDGMLLLDDRNHLSYLDRFAVNGSFLEEYRREYSKFTAIKKRIKELDINEAEKEYLKSTLSAQIAELEKASINPGELTSLEHKRDMLRNSEKLREYVQTIYGVLCDDSENASDMLRTAFSYSGKAGKYSQEFDSVSDMLSRASELIDNAVSVVTDIRDSIDSYEDDYDSLESRIKEINRLMRKYNTDDDGLIERLFEMKEKLSSIENNDILKEQLLFELKQQHSVCNTAADKLSASRRSAASVLEQRISSELSFLSMPSVRFKVCFEDVDAEYGLSSSGKDDVSFLMSANAGEELGKISKIASGGELSRIMLALKNVFSESDTVQTLIFDEIDTGVSGIAAQRVAEKLYMVSAGKQVMCVSHLPQIAAMADNNYYISKRVREGRTYTGVELLDREGRIRELSRLHAGDIITEATLAGADEQLKAAEKYKNSLMNGDKNGNL